MEIRCSCRSLRQPLGDAAEHRQRTQRHDERRQTQTSDGDGVQRAAGEPHQHCRGGGDDDRQMPFGRGDAEHNRRQPHHRPDRQIDTARDQNRRQRDREQPELDAQPRDLEQLPAVRKLGAIAVKTTISAAIAIRRSFMPGPTAGLSRQPAAGPRRAQGLRGDRGHDDRALDGALPIGAHAKECQRRTDRAEQHDTQHRAGEGGASAGDRRAADDDRGNHPHLEAEPRVARDLIEARGIDDRRQAGQHPGRREHPELHPRDVEAGETRGGRARSRREYGPSGREAPARPRRSRAPAAIVAAPMVTRKGRLREPQPLKRRRQVLHPLALRRPSQRIAQRHHRRQRDDDRGHAEPGDERTVERAEQRAEADDAEHHRRQRQRRLSTADRRRPSRSRRPIRRRCRSRRSR